MLPIPRRAGDAEWMDRLDLPLAELGPALAELRWTNRWLGGVSTLLRLIRPHLLEVPPGGALRILDVGTGSADLPCAVVDLARRLGRRVTITAVDGHPATAACAARHARRPEIAVVCADARRLPFGRRSFDLVTASLFLHHFEDAEVVRLLASFRRLARRAVLINDLRRHVVPWGFIALAARLTGRHAVYVHDAPLSVRRGFTVEELERAAREAGVTGARVRRRWPYRLMLDLPADRE